MGNVYAALVQRVGSVHAACIQRAGSMQAVCMQRANHTIHTIHMSQDPFFDPTGISVLNSLSHLE